MLASLIGKKVGMTQVIVGQSDFVGATVVQFHGLIVSQIKKQSTDGYNALQVGFLKKRFLGLPFDLEWFKRRMVYFHRFVEIDCGVELIDSFSVGQILSLKDLGVSQGDLISVTGTSKGLGFEGCVKRHGFAGGPKSHGSKFHRIPGAVGHRRTHGEVDKGKRLPGHMGADRITVKNLRVLHVDVDDSLLFLKGAIPGKSGFYVRVLKHEVKK